MLVIKKIIFFIEKIILLRIKKIREYKKYIDSILNTVKEELEILKKIIKGLDPNIIHKLLIHLSYLSKHIAFKEEQECRIMTIKPFKDKNVIVHEDNRQMFINYLAINNNTIEKIYMGPKITDAEFYTNMLRHYGLDEVECCKSNHPFT